MGDVEVQEKARKTTEKWIICICTSVFLMVAYCIFFCYFQSSNQVDVRDLRIEFADAVSYAEAGEYEKLQPYESVVVGMDAKVVYSNSKLYIVGETVNLHALSTGNSMGSVVTNRFISPLVDENGQIGTLVVMVPKVQEMWSVPKWLGFLFPLLLFMIFINYCAIQLQRYIKRDIVKPVNDMILVTEEILKGNYEIPIHYDNENEIGKLCRNMEFVCDELHNSSTQSKKIHENEKILLACISHDLKTPIATISGCAEGIRDGVAKNPADIERYVSTILTKSELLTKLINDILAHTDAELDELTLNRQEVYAKQYIPEVLAELASDIQGSGLEFKVDEIPDVLLDIAPDRIFQVFQNIIGNSIKYTLKGAFIHITFEQCKNALAVEITDNGQGITATDIPFVFDRFYRGEKARTQKEIGGSGLGLSIVRNIIERHGGRVECDSVLGQGTAIRFLLPMA